jgi:TonB family protein
LAFSSHLYDPLPHPQCGEEGRFFGISDSSGYESSTLFGKPGQLHMVHADGRVGETQILRAEPEAVFEETVLKALRDCRFHPASLIGDTPVDSWWTMAIGFKLTE